MLHSAYCRPVDYRLLAPQAVGMERIGHFGFFRPASEQRLWPLVANWLADRCPAPDALESEPGHEERTP
jgi:hypothetical protein